MIFPMLWCIILWNGRQLGWTNEYVNICDERTNRQQTDHQIKM